MTFKGHIYQTIIDIERDIFIQKYRLKMYMIKHKYFHLQNFQVEEAEALSLINLQRALIRELEKEYKECMKCINSMETQLHNIEYQLFKYKFIDGLSNTEIIDKLHISESTFFSMCNNIKKVLESTTYGKYLDQTLIEE